MRRFGTIACMVAMLGVAASSASAATLTVFELAFNIDGTTYSSQAGQLDNDFPVPGLDDPSGFLATGLGSLTLDFTPTVTATTTFNLLVYLDLEIDEQTNTFFNEYGAVSGAPPAGVSWEIDEPGFVFGNIYEHAKAGTLDNTNALADLQLPDDVALALAWTFTLDPGQWAALTFGTSLTAPAGFSLLHIDPDSPVRGRGTTVYFNGSLDIKSDQIAEPVTMLLLGMGLLFGARRFTRH